MVVGDAMARNHTGTTEANSLSFRCFDANFGGNPGNPHPGTGTDTHELPNKQCAGGIRANTFFPQSVIKLI